jgi:hypothetical protein
MSESLDARWLRRLLSAIVILLAIIAVELSVMLPPLQARSYAQILPDSARQRADQLAEQVKTNATLERILDQLRTGTVKVKVASTDKDSERAPTSKSKIEVR